MKTITTVKVLADFISSHSVDGKLERFDALLPLTIDIEDGVLILGSHNGPDLWRAKLEDLTQ